MGIQLADAGYDFTIFDRADGFGGTWRHNTFPGAACDVPSHLYSYSFALNPRWSKTYANQPEILAYLEKVAADHGLGAHLRPNTAVTTVRWSDSARRWTLSTDDGREHDFDVVVSAVGMLDVPYIPDIPGAQRFRGRQFHSSRWDHSRSTAGERVASIGTGASAIQYVPAIAPETAQLTVFQRTPIWIAPRFDFPFTPEQHELFERDPSAAQKLRDEAFDAYESASFDVDAQQTRDATELARSYLMRKVADPELRAKLTPDYPAGCKRPLMSREWYPTFALPHVKLETTADRRADRTRGAHGRRCRTPRRHRHLRHRVHGRRLPGQHRRVRTRRPSPSRRLERRRGGLPRHAGRPDIPISSRSTAPTQTGSTRSSTSTRRRRPSSATSST